MREINTIVVHCAATTADMDVGAKEIREWHTSPPRSWNDIGYHFVIRRSGEVEKGRPVERQGAHVKGHNDDSIGVCLVGGLNKDHNPEANFTFEQYYMLYQLVGDIREKYGNHVEVKGHKDFDNVHKACPCFNVKAFFSEGE